jgi:hypothetical protein
LLILQLIFWLVVVETQLGPEAMMASWLPALPVMIIIFETFYYHSKVFAFIFKVFDELISALLIFLLNLMVYSQSL